VRIPPGENTDEQSGMNRINLLSHQTGIDFPPKDK